MLKYVITCIFITIATLLLAQKRGHFAISGIIVSKQGQRPITEATVLYANKKSCVTNNLGEFTVNSLKRGQHKLTFTAPGYARVDTVINIDSVNTTFVWDINAACTCIYNKEKALQDIEKGKARLLVPGGFAPVIYSTDKNFKEKYNIGYNVLGCVDFDNEDCMALYNHTIFNYLDKKYGTGWRRDVRKDVEGLKRK